MAGGRDVCTLKCRKGHSFQEEAETTFVCGSDTQGRWNGLNKVKLPKCSSKLNVQSAPVIKTISTLSGRFGIHDPPLLTFRTDRLDLRGLDPGKLDVKGTPA